MELDQAQTSHPGKSSKTRLSAKNKRQAVPLKQSRLSSELETLRAVSKRTFSSGNRMAVRSLLGAIFDLVSLWESEDRLEEGLSSGAPLCGLGALTALCPREIGSACAADRRRRQRERDIPLDLM